MSNKARCEACNVVIISKYRHDFAQCPGGHIFVDGGDDYSRYGYDIPHNFTRILDDGTEENMVDSLEEYQRQETQKRIDHRTSLDSAILEAAILAEEDKTSRILNEVLETLRGIKILLEEKKENVVQR